MRFAPKSITICCLKLSRAGLNTRPFMTAEVLRQNKEPKLNITWDKGRGKDVESAPWFKTFGGDRINDHHLTRAEKLAARSKA